MAANLLAHAGHLFAAGVARSGAYNRFLPLLCCLTASLRCFHRMVAELMYRSLFDAVYGRIDFNAKRERPQLSLII